MKFEIARKRLLGGAVALAALSGMALAVNPSATAGENVLFTGVEVNGDGFYSYLGAVMPLGHTLTDSGFNLKAIGRAFDFSHGGSSNNYSAKGFGGIGAVGYQFSGPNGYVAGYIGASVTDLDNRSNRQDGTRIGANFSADGEFRFSPSFKLGLLGSYDTAWNDYWARARLGIGLGGFSIGPEAVIGGGDLYRMHKLGAFIEGISIGPVGIGINAGFQFSTKGRNNSDPYGGLAVAFKF